MQDQKQAQKRSSFATEQETSPLVASTRLTVDGDLNKTMWDMAKQAV
jgi:hypothetical protein